MDLPYQQHKKINRFRLWRRFREQGALQVMAGLGMLWLLIFAYLPMPGLYIAISDYNVAKPIFSSPFVGLKYINEFFRDENVLDAIINTLGIGGLNITIGFVIPIIFALLLNELAGLKFKKIVQTVSYLPHFISWVILGGFLISWTSEAGLFNELMLKFGLIKEPIYLLAEPEYFWGTAVVSGIWKEMGWSAIIYIAAIAGVNPELYESATVDGARRMQRIWFVTLPSIQGTIAILFTMHIAYILSSNFDQIFVLKNNLNASRSTVLDIYTYRVGIQQGRFSYSAAVGLIKSVFSLALLLLSNKVSDKLTGTSLL